MSDLRGSPNCGLSSIRTTGCASFSPMGSAAAAGGGQVGALGEAPPAGAVTRRGTQRIAAT